jgi:ABC-2 type transport system permease protein
MSLWSSVFQILLFYFLSKVFHADPIEVAPGHYVDYFPYVMVGIALYSMLTNGIHVFTNSLRAEQTTGTLEVLFTLPTSPSVIMFGMASYGFMYSVISSVMLLTVAITMFGLRPVVSFTSIAGTLATLISSLFLFASVGIVIGAFTLVFKRASSLVTMVTQILGLLSGVYFPTTALPKWLQILGEVIPLTWALRILRQTILTGVVPGTRILVLLLACGLAVPAAMFTFYIALRQSRKDGSLGQY